VIPLPSGRRRNGIRLRGLPAGQLRHTPSRDQAGLHGEESKRCWLQNTPSIMILKRNEKANMIRLSEVGLREFCVTKAGSLRLTRRSKMHDVMRAVWSIPASWEQLPKRFTVLTTGSLVNNRSV